CGFEHQPVPRMVLALRTSACPPHSAPCVNAPKGTRSSSADESAWEMIISPWPLALLHGPSSSASLSWTFESAWLSLVFSALAGPVRVFSNALPKLCACEELVRFSRLALDFTAPSATVICRARGQTKTWEARGVAP